MVGRGMLKDQRRQPRSSKDWKHDGSQSSRRSDYQRPFLLGVQKSIRRQMSASPPDELFGLQVAPTSRPPRVVQQTRQTAQEERNVKNCHGSKSSKPLQRLIRRFSELLHWNTNESFCVSIVTFGCNAKRKAKEETKPTPEPLP